MPSGVPLRRLEGHDKGGYSWSSWVPQSKMRYEGPITNRAVQRVPQRWASKGKDLMKVKAKGEGEDEGGIRPDNSSGTANAQPIH